MERRGQERSGRQRIGKVTFSREVVMKRVRFTVEGVTPHLVNKFTDAAAMNATEGTRGSHIGQSLTPREDAESRLNVNERGEPIAPSPALLCMLIDAGRFHKVGKNKVSTQKSSLIPAAVTFPEVYFLLVSEGGWKVDTRPVRIPATGGRILRHRPCFDDWRIEVEVILDEKIIPVKLFRQIVDDAGTRVGFSDFNPQHRGPFGKFSVTNWQVSEQVFEDAA